LLRCGWRDTVAYLVREDSPANCGSILIIACCRNGDCSRPRQSERLIRFGSAFQRLSWPAEGDATIVVRGINLGSCASTRGSDHLPRQLPRNQPFPLIRTGRMGQVFRTFWPSTARYLSWNKNRALQKFQQRCRGPIAPKNDP
jgi:hypothetical protein